MILWYILMSAWAGVLIFWCGFTLGKRNRIPQKDVGGCSHACWNFSGQHYARSPSGSIWVKIT